MLPPEGLPRVALPPGFLTAPIAHRALHDRAAGRIENSRAAVLAAIAGGYGIEIDVQLTADGKAVVFHDYALSRLTGEKGPVRMRTAAELAGIGLTGGDEGIPGLAEILDLVAGRVPLLIEIKDQDGAVGPSVGVLEAVVARAVAGYAGPLAIMSFNPYAVMAFGALAPHIPRGIVTSAYTATDWPLIPAATRDRLRSVPDYAAAGASFISHEAKDLGSAVVARLKAQGAAVNCWTIRSAQAEAEARKVADTITFEGYTPRPA